MRSNRLREVSGFPGYWIHPSGRVYSTRRYPEPVLLKPYINQDGYPTVVLYVDRKPKYFLVHRLVLITFAGPCPEGMECCHRDGIRTNCKRSNLYWGTDKQNAADCIAHGNRPRHEQHGRSKLTVEQVYKIKKLARRGISKAEMGRMFGVSAQQVSRIVSGKQWAGA